MRNKSNILVITYWDYNDALIQTYTLPYLKIIANNLSKSKIFLVTLAKSPNFIQTSHPAISVLSFKYYPFGLKAFIHWGKIIFQLWKCINKNNIQTIHTWCTPAAMMGYFLSKITATSLIIDSYEPHAEAMVENGTWKKNSISYRLLFFFEKLQTKKASILIATTESMMDYAKRKYDFTPRKFYVKPACVDLEIFSFANRKKNKLIAEFGFEKKIVCVYAGKFGGIYLSNEIFSFFKVAHLFWGDKFRILLLTAHTSEEIYQYCKASELDYSIIRNVFLSHNEIADYMGMADFGITPVKPVPTKKYCSPIKNGEYWALGLPVVITPNISIDSQLIKKYNIGSVIESLDTESYLNSIKDIDALLSEFSTKELYDRIRPVAEKHRNFLIAEKIYKEIYSEL